MGDKSVKNVELKMKVMSKNDQYPLGVVLLSWRLLPLLQIYVKRLVRKAKKIMKTR